MDVSTSRNRNRKCRAGNVKEDVKTGGRQRNNMILTNTNTGVSIGVYNMPYRKKPCLAIREGNVLTKYASFNNNFAAAEFMKKLRNFIGVEDMEAEE